MLFKCSVDALSSYSREKSVLSFSPSRASDYLNALWPCQTRREAGCASRWANNQSALRICVYSPTANGYIRDYNNVVAIPHLSNESSHWVMWAFCKP